MITQWHYHYAGLSIASELPIPEWSIFERKKPDRNVDVRILLDRIRQTDTPGRSESWLSPDEFRLCIPEAGEYRIMHGREIVVSPAPAAGEGEVRLFLLGSAWGALCYQRGIPAMHASVVLTSAGAVAFCGAPGAGKSTLAAWLLARGYELVSDDLCCVDVTGPVPRVYLSAPRLKLWSDALAMLELSSEGLARDLCRMDKFIIELTADKKPVRRAAIPLRAVCVLEWGNPGLTRLRGMNALRRLVSSATYRTSFIESLGKTGSYWEQCVQLARLTPVWVLRRPQNWAAMEGAISRIAQQWRPVERTGKGDRNLPWK